LIELPRATTRAALRTSRIEVRSVRGHDVGDRHSGIGIVWREGVSRRFASKPTLFRAYSELVERLLGGVDAVPELRSFITILFGQIEPRPSGGFRFCREIRPAIWRPRAHQGGTRWGGISWSSPPIPSAMVAAGRNQNKQRQQKKPRSSTFTGDTKTRALAGHAKKKDKKNSHGRGRGWATSRKKFEGPEPSTPAARNTLSGECWAKGGTATRSFSCRGGTMANQLASAVHCRLGGQEVCKD